MNRALEAKARTLAGWKGYPSKLPGVSPEFVTGAYRQLFEIERSLRISKHDPAARPIYHHKRESIDAQPDDRVRRPRGVRFVEERTVRSIGKFVRIARRYRTVHIRAGQQILTAKTRSPMTSARRSRRSADWPVH